MASWLGRPAHSGCPGGLFAQGGRPYVGCQPVPDSVVVSSSLLDHPGRPSFGIHSSSTVVSMGSDGSASWASAPDVINPRQTQMAPAKTAVEENRDIINPPDSPTVIVCRQALRSVCPRLTVNRDLKKTLGPIANRMRHRSNTGFKRGYYAARKTASGHRPQLRGRRANFGRCAQLARYL